MLKAWEQSGNVNVAARHTIRKGGATLSPGTLASVTMSEGYMVGGIVEPLQIRLPIERPADTVAAHLRAFMVRPDVVAALRASGRFVGTWLDEKGTVYIDVSEVFASVRNALKVARGRGELAIWDNAAGASIEASEGAA